MPESIIWSFNVQVSGGPKQSLAQTLSIDAYDVLNVTVPATGSLDVAVQPSASGKVLFLLITSTPYDDGTGKLTYKSKITPAPTPAPPILNLDGPQLFANAGLINLLGSIQETFTFKNDLAHSASISILVGRKA